MKRGSQAGMKRPTTTLAVTETQQRKQALKEIATEYAPQCTSRSVEYAEFHGDLPLYRRLRRRAKEAGLIFEYYENSRGFHICLMTRDLSDYSY